jgi:hypothetical protein
MVRGTFGRSERFSEYRHKAYKETTPAVGPQNYEPMNNFKKQMMKHSRVVMVPQFYQGCLEFGSGSNKSFSSGRQSLRSAGSARSFIKENRESITSLQRAVAFQRNKRNSDVDRSPSGSRYLNAKCRTMKSGLKSGRKPKSYTLAGTGHYLQPSPMQPAPEQRLNYNIYE